MKNLIKIGLIIGLLCLSSIASAQHFVAVDQGQWLGPELVTNGTFDSDLSGWTSLALETFEWVANDAHIVETGTNYSRIFQDVGITVGKTYQCCFDATKNSGANLILQYGDGPATATTILEISSSGSHCPTFTASEPGGDIVLKIKGAPADWNLDNISCRRVYP